MCIACNPYCTCPFCDQGRFCHVCGHWAIRSGEAAPEAAASGGEGDDSSIRGCTSKCPLCGDPCVGGGGPHIYHACSNGHAWEARGGATHINLGPQDAAPPSS